MATNKNREIIVLLVIVLIAFVGWAGLTLAGFIPDYFNIKISKPDLTTTNTFDSAQDFVGPGSDSGTLDNLGKPVIYLYPIRAQNVKVSVDLDGKFLATYPDYSNKGWNVFAYPDGRIINKADGKEYSYLFWEGVHSNEVNYNMTRGFVVPGVDTAKFLQTKLSALGLTPKEYNEFIVYWMPKMLYNKYNLIHFATGDEYNDRAKLNIDPPPDSVLRVFMVFKRLSEPVDIESQEIKPFSRDGFTVIEWGGTEIE